ncbi:MAG: hypothetical protein WC389_05530 [Lutibacter sp.]|jgi:hypothetical protein
MKKNINVETERNRLTLTMSRIDHYYDSVNNKSAVYIAINTFITGGVLVLITQVEEPLAGLWNLAEFCLWSCSAFGIFSLVLLALTSIPFVSKKPNSIYYFGTIGAMSELNFNKKSSGYTNKKDLKDLRLQVHILSKGLTSKFEKLKWVGYLLMAQFLFLIPTIIYLLTKI